VRRREKKEELRREKKKGKVPAFLLRCPSHKGGGREKVERRGKGEKRSQTFLLSMRSKGKEKMREESPNIAVSRILLP